MLERELKKTVITDNLLQECIILFSLLVIVSPT